MSRLKRLLAGSALAATFVAVPAVPAAVRPAPAPVRTSTAQPAGVPACMNCW